MDSIKEAGHALIIEELTEKAKKREDIKLSEDKIKIKINQTLHKLANRKNLLKKVKHSGRGYAYALKEWETSKGDLPKKYQR
ncbi:MAG: hypothetical protein R3350_05965, partial [Saprospiraceae bacterium]|nr:hypothetical protein [Saprospiraceae bacterium]